MTKTNKLLHPEKRNIDSINAAKRRLLELETVEKQAAELEKELESEAHFVDWQATGLMIGEIILVIAGAGKIYYFLTRPEPPSILGFLSILLSIGIAGILVWRLDGWRRAKRNEKQLKKLKTRIENEESEIEKILD